MQNQVLGFQRTGSCPLGYAPQHLLHARHYTQHFARRPHTAGSRVPVLYRRYLKLTEIDPLGQSYSLV